MVSGSGLLEVMFKKDHQIEQYVCMQLADIWGF